MKKINERKVALVTGGSRGIGRATAITLAQDGYDVVVNYHKNEIAAQEVVRIITEMGKNAWMIQADLTKDEQVTKMAKIIEERVGRLDLIVNNAGYDHAKLIEDYSIAEMISVVDIILFAKIRVTKQLLSLLKKSNSGMIVNIASRMGKEMTIPTIGAYGPAEAGVIKWTQCCALEFAKYKIRVNCVAPGLTKTDLTKTILSEEEFIQAARNNPSGRVGNPYDVAGAVSFLVSDKASYINGETIGVNGGSNLG
jgi:3-oxoacyl-[acyl-carrier protein] reductase